MCVYVKKRERDQERVCVYVKERERERERERDSVRVFYHFIFAASVTNFIKTFSTKMHAMLDAIS